MNQDQIIVTVGLLFVAVFYIANWRAKDAKGTGLHNGNKFSQPPNILSRPPGPKPDWLIGNIRQFPKGRLAETFTAWQRIYGDLIYMTVLGRGILVVNSLDMAKEFLVRRSATWSGRHHVVMIGDLMGWDWIITNINPGIEHTEGRKIFKQSLGTAALPQYDPIVVSELEKLVSSIHTASAKPTKEGSGGFPLPTAKTACEAINPLTLVTHAIASIIVRITYGDGVFDETGEELIKLNTETVRQLSWVAGQFFLVEYLPFLRHLPEWTPGAQFKKVARTGFDFQRRIRFEGWSKATEHQLRGTLGTCLAAEYMDESAPKEKLDTVRDALGVVYGAAVDTTSFTIVIFLSAILSHPEVQSKIHAELDAFLRETSKPYPSPGDQVHLPYLEAAWKESMRWMPTLSLGIPHSTLKDDIYQNWFIPKNTLVFFNAGFWGRDPRIWEDPDQFIPERWLESHNPRASQLPNVYDIAFGLGRRVCPGQYLADRIGFFFVAALLSLFEILPPEGQPVPAPDSFEYPDNFARYPSNLLCRFCPRTTETLYA